MLRKTYLYENRMFINKMRCSIIKEGRKSLEGKEKKSWRSFKEQECAKSHVLKVGPSGPEKD